MSSQGTVRGEANQSKSPSSRGAMRHRFLLDRLLRIGLCGEPGRDDEERIVITISEFRA
jgi:hypothetical protein